MDSAAGVTYAALLEPCSDVQLGHLGLFALSFDAFGELQVGRPLVSGVRALATDNSGRLFAGLRDDNPVYACDGVPITTGFYEIHSNGWARHIRFLPADGQSSVPAFPSVMAAAQNTAGKWALGTWRDGLLVGSSNAAFLWNQATEWRVSLYSTSVLWESENVLWLSGLSSHVPGDSPEMAMRGPGCCAHSCSTRRGTIASAKHLWPASGRI
jgi:hypothetical protein